MSTSEFSDWPGAWERHVIRKSRHPYLFSIHEAPAQSELIQAQLRDQQELTEFNLQLAEVVARCSAMTEDTTANDITAIKKDLDHSYDTACGLGADLHEQKDALILLNEVISNAMRRALRDNDEQDRLLLIKQESVRMRHLTRLSYPIVCDLLRPLPTIPPSELTAALLCETDEAFTVALDVLDDTKRRYLKQGIEKTVKQLQHSGITFRIGQKQKILNKRLLASHAIEEADTG